MTAEANPGRTLGPALAAVLGRELERFQREIAAYPDERDLWRVEGTARNSPGTLALHAAGNLEAYVGAVLGDTGYVRDREAEFGDRDVPRAELIRRLEHARAVVVDTLHGVDDATLLAPYPGPLPAHLGQVSAVGFLVHLTWHLGWHEGQVDYHRRILVGGEPV